MNRSLLVGSLVRSVWLLLLSVSSSAQALHKDERIGFLLRPPRGWVQIPVQVDEAWIVGRYRSEEVERVVDPDSGRQLEHHPELHIIAFLRPKAEPEEDQDAGEGEVEIERETYRDYMDYMRGTYTQGFFVEEEEVIRHGGVDVTCLQIKAERDYKVSEKKILTWIYPTELGEVAVHLEVVEDSFKKYRSAFRKCLKSFKTIERTKELAAGTSEASFLSSIAMKKLKPGERRAIKIERQRASWEKMIEDLPKGWKASELDGVYVVNHGSAKFAKKVVAHVKAIMAWMDETFPEVGPYEYARPPIVRICADQSEEQAFREGSGVSWWAGNHLVTHEARRDDSWEWEYIGERTFKNWFWERDAELYAALPRWYYVGLKEVVESCRSKGRKLDFPMGDLEKFTREDMPRDDGRMPLKAMLTLSRAEFDAYGDQKDWSVWCQAVAFCRFAVNARSKIHREIIPEYLTNLRVVLDELQAEDDRRGEDPVPTNEEEETALMQKRRERILEREAKILELTFERTFGDWDRGDWLGLERAFGRSL